jgi:hypothetical protein
MAGVEVGEKRKPPNESTGLVGGHCGQRRGGWKEETPQRVPLTRWGVVGAGVELGEKRKPPNESTRLVGGGCGRRRGGTEEEAPQRVNGTRWGWL